MLDLISLGNISIDTFFQGESLTFKEDRFQLAVGGKYFTESVKICIGGGGANVAIGASKQGLRTGILSKVGNNPFKSIILDKLHQHKISTVLCQMVDDYWNVSTILLNQTGERTIIHHTTPHLHLFEHHNQWSKLRSTHNVYFGNLNEISLTEKVECLRFLKKNSIRIFMNMGVNDCRRNRDSLMDIFSHIDVLIVNGYEFADLVKAPYQDIHFHDNVINWYLPEMKDKLVVITEGKKGSFAYFKNKVFHRKAISVERIVDTTGAGDGFTAAFIAEYIKKEDITRALEKGAKYASKILQRIGAN